MHEVTRSDMQMRKTEHGPDEPEQCNIVAVSRTESTIGLLSRNFHVLGMENPVSMDIKYVANLDDFWVDLMDIK